MVCRSGVEFCYFPDQIVRGREKLYLGDHSRRELPRNHLFPFLYFSVFLIEMPPAQPRIIPWTPEEDERLASAVASCKLRVIPL